MPKPLKKPVRKSKTPYFAYNFIKSHPTLRVSPAMAAGVTTRLFEVPDLVALLEAAESQKAA